MTKISLIGIVLFFTAFDLSAQLQEVSLEQRVQNASLVFEGKVLSKSSFWDKDRRHIYTSNLVSIYKVFKGEISRDVVELITIGGVVGNQMEKVSYGLELQAGSLGIFTCVPNTNRFDSGSQYVRLKPYGEIQGFIRYDLATGTAKDVFKQYKNVSGDIYPVLQKLTKSDFKIMNKADFKIK